MNVIPMVLGPLQTNCYIVYGKNGKAAVIDPAYSADEIERVLAEKSLILDKILLTHAHFDHIMAAEELRKNGAKLYVHKDDDRMLHDPSLNCMLEFMGRTIDFARTDVLLDDGDVIDIGDERLTVIHTPGHTKGSVCYMSDEYIFSGDTLFCGSVGRCDLYGGSYDTLMLSLKKLNRFEKDYIVFPGHGGNTTLNNEKNDNVYMKILR